MDYGRPLGPKTAIKGKENKPGLKWDVFSSAIIICFIKARWTISK